MFKNRLNVPIDAEIHHRVKIQATLNRVTLGEIVNAYLLQALERVEAQQHPREVPIAPRTSGKRAQQ